MAFRVAKKNVLTTNQRNPGWMQETIKMGVFVVLDGSLYLEEGSEIGDRCILGHGVSNSDRRHLRLDRNSVVKSGAIIYKGVIFGGGVIGHNSIIGQPSASGGSLETNIGKRARIFSNVIIYEGAKLGLDVLVGDNAKIMWDTEIGNDSIIGGSALIGYGVKIGEGTKIQEGVFIPVHSTIGNGCYLGPGVQITNTRHPLCSKVRECIKFNGVTLEDHAKVGTGTIILPGRKIGEGALVGAGSVVTRDVPAGEVWYGNPAVMQGYVRDLECQSNLLTGNIYEEIK